MRIEDLLKETVTLPEGVLKEAMAKQKKIKQDRLSEQLIGLIENFEQHLAAHVANVRNIRRQEKEALSKLKEVNSALDKFKKDGNPFPFFKVTGNLHGARNFCNTVGVEYPDKDSEAWKL